MNMKRNIIKLLVFACSFVVFVGSSFAVDCNDRVPPCVSVHVNVPQKIEVVNRCDVKVALKIQGENAVHAGGHINLSKPNNNRVFEVGPPIPINPAKPAYYSGLSCCPEYGEGYGCPQKPMVEP